MSMTIKCSMPAAISANYLHDAGLKATRPRLRVIDVLRARPRKHLTAEAICQSLRDRGVYVSMPTVYRVVADLERAGIIRRTPFANGHAAVFEFADNDSHDHMICVETGRIIEFHDKRFEKLAHGIAKQHGYDVESCNLVLYVRRETRSGSTA